MYNSDAAVNPRRGTALLIITMIVIAGTSLILILPDNWLRPDLEVRVAIIDSGINNEGVLETRVIAEKSFVNISYGYNFTDLSTEDSEPGGSPHGTHVAEIIVNEAPNVALIDAKVVSYQNKATEEGIIAAIQWAILDQDCDVINLSLGGAPANQDLLCDVISWAFQRGVIIVAAVGNNGNHGIPGSSIESPAVYDEVIGVAAVDDAGSPYWFSGIGPLRNRTLKPDISALGHYTVNGGTLFGTSFAAPIVSGGVARLIEYCITNEWDWTPGLIKATILTSAKPLASEAWEVGAGLLDVDTAIRILDDTPKRDRLPLVAWVSNNPGPFGFERWFVNTTAKLELAVFCSDNATFEITYQGTGAHWTGGPDRIEVNQTGCFTIQIKVISSTDIGDLETLVTLVAPDYYYVRAQIDFEVSRYFSKVAIDVSHSPWWIDSIYGQFREMYKKLTGLGIAIEELSNPSEVTLQKLLEFDAVLILDPCVWDKVMIADATVIRGSMKYSTAEINTYTSYWDNGGSIFVAGLSNYSMNVGYSNKLLSYFNMTFNYDRFPSVTINIGGTPSTGLVKDIATHRITQGIESFDYVGCSLNYSGNGNQLAWTTIELEDQWGFKYDFNKTLMASLEGDNGARLIVTGSNFFIDNYALSGAYQSQDNSKFMLQMIYWLVGWY